MIDQDFVSDMAVEAAQAANLSDLCKLQKLSYGIEQRFLNIKTLDLAKKVGRERGVYVTYDCPKTIYENERHARALEKYLAQTVNNLVGTQKKSSPILVVGLGNADIVADSLGQRAAENIKVTRKNMDVSNFHTQCVCALQTGVLGTTGMQSNEVTSAIVEKIKPCLVILIDALATSCVSRVGTSFQISTAGITPGSGVGQDKERIDKSTLGVPVLAIGVPLMLSMRTALYNFVKDYTEALGCKINEFTLREELIKKNLSNLVVTPKDIDVLAQGAGLMIANAINSALN